MLEGGGTLEDIGRMRLFMKGLEECWLGKWTEEGWLGPFFKKGLEEGGSAGPFMEGLCLLGPFKKGLDNVGGPAVDSVEDWTVCLD